MSKIEMENGKLSIPDTVTIPFIEGDGVGAEITPVSQMVVNEAVKKAYNGKKSIEWKEVLAGDKAQKELGTPLPDETIKIFEEYLIGIKGPLTTPVGEGMRSLNVTLRQTLDLYVCLRPVRWFKGTSSPIKEPNKVNMVVFRENTEDIYAGIEWKTGTEEAKKFYNFLKNEMGVNKVRFPETSSFGVKPVSEEGSKRLIKSAIEYAIENKLPSVTLVHKGNIMKFTEGGFKKYGYELARKEFADKTFTMEEYAEIKKEWGKVISALPRLYAGYTDLPYHLAEAILLKKNKSVIPLREQYLKSGEPMALSAGMQIFSQKSCNDYSLYDEQLGCPKYGTFLFDPSVIKSWGSNFTPAELSIINRERYFQYYNPDCSDKQRTKTSIIDKIKNYFSCY